MEMNTPQSGMNKDLFFSYEQVDSFYFTIYDNLAFFNYFFLAYFRNDMGERFFFIAEC